MGRGVRHTKGVTLLTEDVFRSANERIAEKASELRWRFRSLASPSKATRRGDARSPRS